MLVPLVLAGTAIGFFVGRAPGEYVSDTEIVVAAANRPLGPGSVSGATSAALAELAHSRVVAKNVIEALKLHESSDQLLGRMSVATPRPGILRISVRDANRVRARRIAAQVDLVYSTLIQADFGSRTPVPLRTTVWDPAGKAKPVAGHEVLGSLLGALGGVLAAALVLLGVTARRRPAPVEARPEAEDPRERRAAERERVLAEREAALDARAAELAEAKRQALREQAGDLEHVEQARARLHRDERDLERRKKRLDALERELEGREERLADSERELVSQPAEPEAVADAPPEPVPAAVQNGQLDSRWNLDELERRVENNASRHPDRIEEWRYYILYLRGFAGPGGGLPRSFDALVEEVFADLLRAAA